MTYDLYLSALLHDFSSREGAGAQERFPDTLTSVSRHSAGGNIQHLEEHLHIIQMISQVSQCHIIYLLPWIVTSKVMQLYMYL